MTLQLYQVAMDVRTLGHGSRAAVWVQGCNIGCADCCTKETWDPALGHTVEISTILHWIRSRPHSPDGLTVSGGEPTSQAPQVLELIQAFIEAYPHSDVLLFTGLRFEVAVRQYPDLIAACDVVCAGPYMRGLPALPLRGSSNQTLHCLSPRARERYRDVDSWPIRSQVTATADRIITVGIPDAALKRVGSRLSEGYP